MSTITTPTSDPAHRIRPAATGMFIFGLVCLIVATAAAAIHLFGPVAAVTTGLALAGLLGADIGLTLTRVRRHRNRTGRPAAR